MVEVKVHVVQMRILVSSYVNLVQLGIYVAQVLQVLRPHLTYMQVHQMTIVTIYLKQLIFVQVFEIHVVLDMDMLVWQHD